MTVQTIQTSRQSPARISNRWGIWLINGLAIAYSFGQMTQAPMLPYIWRDLGGGDLGYGLWFVEFCTLQLIGNMCSGPAIQRFGAQAWFAVSNTAAVFMFAITAVAWNFWILYVSRMPAILELGILSTRALIAERTRDQDRAAMLGYLGMAHGIGATLGSVVGGELSNISLQFCAWFATIVALPCVAATFLIPPAPEEHTSQEDEEQVQLAIRQPESSIAWDSSRLWPKQSSSAGRPHSGSKSKPDRGADAMRAAPDKLGKLGHERGAAPGHVSSPGKPDLRPGSGRSAVQRQGLQQVIRLCLHAGVPSLLCIKVLLGSAFAIVSWTVGFVLDRQYQLQPKVAGWAWAYVGVVTILSQGCVVGPVSRALSCRHVVVAFGWALAAGYACMGLSAHSVSGFLVAVAPIWTCTGVIDTIVTAQLTKIVPEDGKAAVLSVDVALLGLAGAVAPFVGTSLYSTVGFIVFSGVGGALITVMLLLVHTGILAC